MRILGEKISEKIDRDLLYYRKYILSLKQIVDDSLYKLTSMVPSSILRSRIEYALLGKGKRLRPLMALLSAKSVGGKISDTIRLALAIELVHTATLIHDDIIDQAKYRRGRLALHEKWSESDAIVTGDALIAIAINLISDYESKIIKITSEGALSLCSGELVDATMSLDKVDEEVYFKKLIQKSSVLFKVAAECGGIVGGGGDDEVSALSKYGENYGVAYQLKDDLEDALNRENLFIDLMNGRVTYPLIYMYYNGSNRIKEILSSYINDKNRISNSIVDEIIKEIKRPEIMKHIRRKIENYIDNACKELSKLRESTYKALLIFLAKQIKSRFEDVFDL